MPAAASSKIRLLDLGPAQADRPVHLQEQTTEGKPLNVAVAGCLVVLAPEVSAVHRQDVLQSLLLAQLAANAKADRHRNPGAWFQAYRGVLEQVAWVVASSSGATRYLAGTARYTASAVVNDVFRRQLAEGEATRIAALLNDFRRDLGGMSQWVFECPSHSGGTGNFQVALAREEEGALSLGIAQLSFTTPQHVVRLMFDVFDERAQFKWAFLHLTQNEQIYAKLRNDVAAKVESRFDGSVAVIS